MPETQATKAQPAADLRHNRRVGSELLRQARQLLGEAAAVTAGDPLGVAGVILDLDEWCGRMDARLRRAAEKG